MKQKTYIAFISLILLISKVTLTKNNIYSNQKIGTTEELDNSNSNISANTLDVDLKNNTLKSKDGIQIRYGNFKIKTFDFEKNDSLNTVLSKGYTFLELEDGSNKIKTDTRDVTISQDGNYAIYYDSFSYALVGEATGAESPNDKIFFGAEVTDYSRNKLTLRNAWFSTDPKILNSKKPEEAGYHLKSKKIDIIPDKQINFYSSQLYVKDKKAANFTMPWYAVNIRPGSEVPVFPIYGSEEDYGGYQSWGVLYGEKEDKYKGGFAPKHSSDLGWLIGRWENQYTFDKAGVSKFDLTDYAVAKKSSDQEDRWKANLSHAFNSSNGFFNINLINSTQNMVEELEDIRDDNEDDGFYDKKHPRYKNKDRPDGGDTINLLSLDTEFNGIGKDKDIDFYAKIKRLDDKEAYQEVVDDRLDDVDYDTQRDHDLFSNVGFVKDNEKYKIKSYYEYLYDMDPGSSEDDLKTRVNNFGFEFNDKIGGFKFKYDEKNEDEYRKLRSWERSPNLDDIVNLSGKYDREVEYVPWTVEKYSKNDSRNLEVVLGNYNLSNTHYTLTPSFSMKKTEKELSDNNDPFREKSITDGAKKSSNKINKRDQEYNRFEDIIYEKRKETRSELAFENSNNNTTLIFATGRTEEEIWDREGIYVYDDFEEGDAYNKYVNKSDYYEIEIAKTNLSTVLGVFEVKYNGRYDDYDEGYSNGKDTDGGDSSFRNQITLGHSINILDNTNNYLRNTDISLDNDFKYFYQNYDYSAGDHQLASGHFSSEEIRLKHKDNIQQFIDTVTFDFGNTKSIYTIDYKELTDAADDSRKKAELIQHNFDFMIDDKEKLSLYLTTNEKYTNRNNLNSNNKNIDNDTFGIEYFIGNHKFYYQKETLDYMGRHLRNVDDVDETLEESIYGYEYTKGLDILTLEYIKGKDDRTNLETNEEEIETENQIYSIAYLNGGIEGEESELIEHYYKATYEDYDQAEEVNKQYSSEIISFRYEYRDKRFDEEDLTKYSAKEYKKQENEVTPEDLERIKDVLDDRDKNSLDFNLQSIKDEELYSPKYKNHFAVYLMFEKNKERYNETDDYFESLEEIEATILYSYERMGISYTFEQNADWRNFGDSNQKWVETERDHEISFFVNVGKPSESWRIKSFVAINEDLDGWSDKNSDGDNTRNTLDEFGVEVGKEYGYYMWSIGISQEYVSSTDDYEWEIAFQFSLLTFPNMPLFGIGAEDTGDGATYRPYIMEGIEIDEAD